MFVAFDREQLDQLLHDFYKLTGMTVSLWDADFTQLTYQPKEMPLFCKIIKDTKLGNHRCVMSDRKICEECARLKQPVRHKCHAGLVDVALPILYENKLLGFIMFGQIEDKGAPQTTFESIRENLKDLHLNEEMLYYGYKNLKSFDMETVMSAVRILQAVTQFTWLSKMIQIRPDPLATDIDLYLSNHLNEALSVQEICRKFHVSKNKLYKICRENFGESIGAYIQTKRIHVAKQLLIGSKESVYNISAKVGIPDYNYFIKVFKKKLGMTPSTFQRRNLDSFSKKK